MMTVSLRSGTCAKISNKLRFMRASRRLRRRFRAEFGFDPPPLGTDMVGYAAHIRAMKAMGAPYFDGDLVEIGALLGGGTLTLSRFLTEQGSTREIVTVDVFETSTDHAVNTAGTAMCELYDSIVRQTGRSQLERFREVTAECENLRVIVGDSAQVGIPTDEVAFAFVDGNHSPEYVRSDFELLWPKMLPGGVLAFHDYRHDLPEVTREVDRIIEEVEPSDIRFDESTRTVYLRHP
jgi:hypothetical protein